jgi:hypothetical protein
MSAVPVPIAPAQACDATYTFLPSRTKRPGDARPLVAAEAAKRGPTQRFAALLPR